MTVREKLHSPALAATLCLAGILRCADGQTIHTVTPPTKIVSTTTSNTDYSLSEKTLAVIAGKFLKDRKLKGEISGVYRGIYNSKKVTDIVIKAGDEAFVLQVDQKTNVVDIIMKL